VVMSRGAATEFENGNYVYFYFDQFTGELLHKWDRAGQTAGDQIMSWIGFLHVGQLWRSSQFRFCGRFSV
jgi:hypothetical protein